MNNARPLQSWHDSQNHMMAQMHNLTDTYNDLIEAVDGLSWQQDRKKAELAVAEERFKEIASQHATYLYTIENNDTLTDHIHRNQTMADAAMTQLHIATIQKQIDYLDNQIAHTLAKVASIKEEMAEQRKGLRYRRSAVAE